MDQELREYVSERVFRVSSFNPTHRQMILRSDPANIQDGALRVEIYFGNVAYLAVQPVMQSVAVRRATEDEQVGLGDRFGIAAAEREFMYLLTDVSPVSFVISGQPSWRQAERRFDEPSLFDFGQPWPPGDGMEWGTIG
nr:hypothetical protein [Micromonospora sp. DSM 115978]